MWFSTFCSPIFLFNFPYHIILKTGVCLGSESCLGMSQSEQQREFPTEESRIKYAMPSLDRGLQKRKTSKDKSVSAITLALR